MPGRKHYGKKSDQRQCAEKHFVFFTALSAFVLFADAVRHGGSVVLAAVLVGLVDPIVRIVSTPEQAVAGTRTYLIICFIGVPCITAYNIMASIFRGLGDSRSPMYFIAAGLCLASLAVVNEKEYILVTLGHPETTRRSRPTSWMLCRCTADWKRKNDCFAPILPPVGCAGMSGPVQWSHKQNCWLTRRTKRCTN